MKFRDGLFILHISIEAFFFKSKLLFKHCYLVEVAHVRALTVARHSSTSRIFACWSRKRIYTIYFITIKGNPSTVSIYLVCD